MVKRFIVNLILENSSRIGKSVTAAYHRVINSEIYVVTIQGGAA